VIAIKAALLSLGILVSLFLYTLIFAEVWMTIMGIRAMTLPALLHNPPYWLILILLLGCEVWLAMHKVRW
jgi:hypothetical protein